MVTGDDRIFSIQIDGLCRNRFKDRVEFGLGSGFVTSLLPLARKHPPFETSIVLNRLSDSMVSSKERARVVTPTLLLQIADTSRSQLFVIGDSSEENESDALFLLFGDLDGSPELNVGKMFAGAENETSLRGGVASVSVFRRVLRVSTGVEGREGGARGDGLRGGSL